MRVLVTGGTGFIGRALCAALLEQGHDVAVWSRDPARAAAMLPGKTTCDQALERLLPADAVINLAGESLASGRWNPRRKQLFRDSRIGLTSMLVQGFERHGAPAVLVSGSAVGYYGACGDTELVESSPAGNEYQSTLCRDWEEAASRAEPLGTRVCLLRTGVVLGLDEFPGGALQPMLLPFRLGLGSWLGSGRQWMSWIHRRDIVAMILWLLANDALSGPFNATAPEPATNKDFSRALGRALHRPVLFGLPGPVVRLLIGEMAHLLLTGQRVLPQAAQAGGFSFDYPSVDTAFGEIFG